ncbi:hypothetical protein AB0I94_35930 [Streptomyces sp. NPDC050147]|uniref:hypothetical protein n=1 Tax=Streptomyces sp. NPDC050147 TaxID=3155513 RepID=UPI00343F6C32
MALTLFARRPEPVEAPAPAPWPEIGETWKPEGATVVQRYYNQAHAVVLVYTAAENYRHVVACLGCHFTKANSAARSCGWLDLKGAADIANGHATTCRALPRDIPSRPDDDAVRDQLRQWVVGQRRHQSEDTELWISFLDPVRPTLQRTNIWIETALRQLADTQPDIVVAKTSEYTEVTRFYARSYPEI